MRFMKTVPLFLSLALPAFADTPMTAEEFDAYTQGRTILYSTDGVPTGAETYLRNRRVRWSFLQDECQDGYWYPEGENICFVYDAVDGPQCWTFSLNAGRLHADFVGGGTPLLEIPVEHELICMGPDVGV
ncbi:MAG: hypothetical protein VX444_00720 [Pseudomonadota bacterium]|nr:hypothetical protein [Pseudomonadota bacterium]